MATIRDVKQLIAADTGYILINNVDEDFKHSFLSDFSQLCVQIAEDNSVPAWFFVVLPDYIKISAKAEKLLGQLRERQKEKLKDMRTYVVEPR